MFSGTVAKIYEYSRCLVLDHIIYLLFHYLSVAQVNWISTVLNFLSYGLKHLYNSAYTSLKMYYYSLLINLDFYIPSLNLTA